MDGYTDFRYTVTLTVRGDISPTESEVTKALYQGVEAIDTEDAIEVTLQRDYDAERERELRDG